MANNYLIALDLDGTLLDDNKKISKTTQNYLKLLESKGNYVVLCSGRSNFSINSYHKEIGLHSPFIGFNGSTIVGLNSFYYDNKLNYKSIKKIYAKLKPYCSNAFSQSKNFMFYDYDKDFVSIFFNDKDLKLVEGPLDLTLNEDPYTFVIKFKDLNEEKKEYFKNLVNRIDDNLNLRFWWSSDCGEVHLKFISKAFALTKIIKELNIKEENVIVFGDADNDIEMLKSYKNSFLMKNGNLDLKRYARNISLDTNNNDGVMKTLKAFLKE